MSQASKKFHFATGVEGWTLTSGHPNCIVSWRENKKAHHPNALALAMGGCLRATAMGNAANAVNSFSYTTTWQALGVPAGQPVTSVTAEYRYRWDFGKQFGTNSVTASCGPLELLNSSGTSIGTFSGVTNCNVAGRSNGRNAHWPIGYAPPGSGVPSIFTDDDVLPGWGRATSSAISVPTASQASGSTITFKLTNTFGPVPHSQSHDFVRFKADRFVITATYGATAPATIRRIFVV